MLGFRDVTSVTTKLQSFVTVKCLNFSELRRKLQKLQELLKFRKINKINYFSVYTYYLYIRTNKIFVTNIKNQVKRSFSTVWGV